MTDSRTIEDRLREEYFRLLPDIRRLAEHLEAEVKYLLLPIRRKLDRYEQVAVTSRVKDCESALDSLRRKQEGAIFEPEQPTRYTLTSLSDLAGVRVLAFPSSRVAEVDEGIRKRFNAWESDPVTRLGEAELPLVFKYSGYCNEASDRVRGEIQIVPMLIGLFWEVEHSAVYKPSPRLKGVAAHPEMQRCASEVYRALRAFEHQFEALLSEQKLGSR
jgi:ppGpp synthetase/RelA/SpoT-type nucleotidyltranferase